jgi:hypothetical protein
MRLLLSRFKLVFVLCMHELGSRRRLFKLWGLWKLRSTGAHDFRGLLVGLSLVGLCRRLEGYMG